MLKSHQKLLITACSQRKRDGDKMAACDRYYGPLYQMMSKTRSRTPWLFDNLDWLILSAKYGLIHHSKLIENYDQKMTRERAESLRPQVNRVLKKFQNQGFEEIYIDLGQLYLEAVGEVGGINNCFPNSRIIYGHGGIGTRTSQVREWLRSEIGEFVPLPKPQPASSEFRYVTPRTRLKWSTFEDWWSLVKDPLERSRRNENGTALRHLKALLATSLIEECEQQDLLQEALNFFSMSLCSNHGFAKPPRGMRENHPTTEVRNRLHNQVAKLRVSFDQLSLFDVQPYAISPGYRFQGANRGEWKHGTIKQTHQNGRVLVLWFDDDSYDQVTYREFVRRGYRPVLEIPVKRDSPFSIC